MISIIVCTYNREKFILRCLDSIASQQAKPEEFELIFVNNKSTDNTENIYNDFVSKNPTLNCKYFLEENQGLSWARNRGILESSGHIIAFLDDDAIAREDYVLNLKKQFAESECDAGGGKILPEWETARPKWMGHFLVPLVSVINLGNDRKPFPKSKYPIGANMFFKKEVLEKTGDFNTKLGRTGKSMLGGEEKDIFNRVRENNGGIYYFPEICVSHIIPEERTTIDFIKKQAIGLGKSEYLRTKDNPSDYFSRLFLELIKWAATLVISFFYFLSLQFSKAIMLIRFRFWVTKGLLTKNN